MREKGRQKERSEGETVRVEGRGVRQWEKRGREQNEKRGRDRVSREIEEERETVKGERRE